MNFRVIYLREPPKDKLSVYLESEHLGKHAPTKLNRCARVEVLVQNDTDKNDLREFIVDLDNILISKQKYLVGKHSYIDSAYMKEVEEACMANANVQQGIQTLDLPHGASVIVEPWAYATDGSNDMSRRLTMVSSRIFFSTLVRY